MLRHVLGWGVGCVNVHVNLLHMHMLRLGFPVLELVVACAQMLTQM